MLLAGDIGATKTDLGIFDLESGPREPLVYGKFINSKYPDLETILDEFLKDSEYKIDRASFGVAGPVLEGRVNITNLRWNIDVKRLEKKLKVDRVEILNDIRAIAHAVLCLESSDLEVLNEGVPVAEGHLAVIAPGTGLGEGFLTWDGDRYRTHPSEGGHVDFAPKTQVEFDLMRYLYRDHEHVSYEDVCSGKGIPNIYNFLKEEGGFEEPAWLAGEIKGTDDPNPVIVGSALGKIERSRICEETLSIFVSVLAREAANLALKVVATGGLYIGGGIPRRIISLLKDGRFMEEYTRKGIFSDLLSDIPVYVIMNPKAALIGAARHGLELSKG